MKKYITSISFMVFFLFVGIGLVKAGYVCGPNNHLYMQVKSGSSWVSGTLNNYGEQISKQVYARAGDKGSYSDFSSPETYSITHKDTKGLFEADFFQVKACWYYNNNYNCQY